MYLHIPFCVKKCNYCDFLSAPAGRKQIEEYLQCLNKEIRAYREYHYEADTVFFGGGTPSLLLPDDIRQLMEALRETFYIEETAEVTMECNPETVDREKLAAMKEAGVNRLSFGLQSASDRELLLLGRIHNYERFLAAYTTAREEGFENINIDLMSAIPEQTEKTWEETLEKVVKLNPEHISAYSLIIEEGTVFYEKQEKLLLPDEDAERRMYYRTKEILKAAGYERYEISNYARPGYESRHNLKYWSCEEYIGIGLGASSYLEGVRFFNVPEYKIYRDCCMELGKEGENVAGEDGSGLSVLRREKEKLGEKQKMEEFCFLGLRRMQGISKKLFEEQFGMPIEEVYGKVLKELQEKDLLYIEETRIFLTEKGIDVSNQVFAEFLLD